MKQFFLLIVLLVCSQFAKAQVVTNNVHHSFYGCPVTVTAFCYDPITCVKVSICGSVTLPIMGPSQPLPVCGCPPGATAQGYTISYVTCPGTVDIGTPGIGCFPSADILRSPCIQCGQPTKVSFDGVDLSIDQYFP